MGGMAAAIPVRDDPVANEAAFARVRADKLREVQLGHDGTWVAHPALIPVAREEFELHYQPLVDIAANRISGFESLLRWRHPQKGMISPAEFIPVAEDIGLIVALGEWVLREACAEAMKWPADVKVAVNLSPLQFRTGNLLALVTDALRQSGLPARRLELEITETLLLEKSSQVLATLHALRALGVRMSMDDFGTGYSSLSYLRSFPFDKIKIDQSFVRDLGANPDAQAIVRSIAVALVCWPTPVQE